MINIDPDTRDDEHVRTEASPLIFLLPPTYRTLTTDNNDEGTGDSLTNE